MNRNKIIPFTMAVILLIAVIAIIGVYFVSDGSGPIPANATERTALKKLLPKPDSQITLN